MVTHSQESPCMKSLNEMEPIEPAPTIFSDTWPLSQVELSSSLLIPHYIEQYTCVPFLLHIQNNKIMISFQIYLCLLA